MPLIDIANPSKRFEEHLKIENNFRIIVSGEFGIGKTFFLNNFFEERKNDYNKLVISPVNYVVSSNEDVFELIKADIVYNLFFNHIEINKRKSKSKLEKIDLFIGERPNHFFKFITSSFKKVNPFFEIADSFFESFKQLNKEYDKYVNELENDLKGNDEVLGEYLSTFWDAKGNLFEQDFITQTINHTLSGLRKKGKKNVLIIDDLDRMDPEHIFRVLNILSAHNNYLGQDNKFEFDHIIIVCDYENIKRIYQHRYGEKVDFEGYIDKFYSSDVFFFSNYDALEVYIDSLDYPNSNQYEKAFLNFIYRVLIQNGLTTRKIIKRTINFPFEDLVIYEQKGLQERQKIGVGTQPFFEIEGKFKLLLYDISILRFFKIVSIIYGDFQVFYDLLKNLNEKAYSNVKTNEYRHVLSYLAFQKHLCETWSDKLFFHKKLSGPANSSPNKVILEFEYPKTNLFGHNFDINVGWSKDQAYDGEGSYFKYVRILSNSISESNNSTVNYKDILNALRIIAHDCDKKKLFNKIGIRKIKI